MLVELEDDEDRLGSDGKLFGRSNGNNFVGSLESQFFIKSFGEDDAAKHALWRGVEIIGYGTLCAVLKIRNRHVVSQRKVLCPEEGS